MRDASKRELSKYLDAIGEGSPMPNARAARAVYMYGDGILEWLQR